MKFNGFNISDGNRKMGYVPSFSLPPLLTCRKNAPCSKNCYAVKMCKLHKNVLTSYWNNLNALEEQGAGGLVNAVSCYLDAFQPLLFRWNVSGDIYSLEYWDAITELARLFPTVQFMLYTKQYELVNERLDKEILPRNLVIILSYWTNFYPPNPHNLPTAFYDDHSGNVDAGIFHCQGDCSTCQRCFFMRGGDSVAFYKH